MQGLGCVWKARVCWQVQLKLGSLESKQRDFPFEWIEFSCSWLTQRLKFWLFCLLKWNVCCLFKLVSHQKRKKGRNNRHANWQGVHTRRSATHQRNVVFVFVVALSNGVAGLAVRSAHESFGSPCQETGPADSQPEKQISSEWRIHKKILSSAFFRVGSTDMTWFYFRESTFWIQWIGGRTIKDERFSTFF